MIMLLGYVKAINVNHDSTSDEGFFRVSVNTSRTIITYANFFCRARSAMKHCRERRLCLIFYILVLNAFFF